MAILNIKRVVVLEIETNCYILFKDNSGYCIVIDPGGNIAKIKHRLKSLNLTAEAVLLTHGHGDHIGGCNELGLNCYIHEHDRQLLENPDLNLSSFFNCPIRVSSGIVTFKDNDKLEFLNSGLKFKAMHTPGHTPGSSCFLIEKYLFSGDTLFKDGIGRTDFPYSSFGMLKDSLLNKIFPLPDDILAYPGHGQDTNIGYEKRNNPVWSY